MLFSSHLLDESHINVLCRVSIMNLSLFSPFFYAVNLNDTFFFFTSMISFIFTTFLTLVSRQSHTQQASHIPPPTTILVPSFTTLVSFHPVPVHFGEFSTSSRRGEGQTAPQLRLDVPQVLQISRIFTKLATLMKIVSENCGA